MALRLLRDISRGLIDLVYPRACLVCESLLGDRTGHFCTECRTALTTDPHATCRRCASTVGPNLAPADDCPRCRNESYGFERAIRLGPYEGLRREVILKLKHRQFEGLAEAVGELWADYAAPILRACSVGAVVPVPLHWRRRWQRGHNQAELLARPIAKALRVAAPTPLVTPGTANTAAVEPVADRPPRQRPWHVWGRPRFANQRGERPAGGRCSDDRRNGERSRPGIRDVGEGRGCRRAGPRLA